MDVTCTSVTALLEGHSAHFVRRNFQENIGRALGRFAQMKKHKKLNADSKQILDSEKILGRFQADLEFNMPCITRPTMMPI